MRENFVARLLRRGVCANREARAARCYLLAMALQVSTQRSRGGAEPDKEIPAGGLFGELELSRGFGKPPLPREGDGDCSACVDLTRSGVAFAAEFHAGDFFHCLFGRLHEHIDANRTKVVSLARWQ